MHSIKSAHIVKPASQNVNHRENSRYLAMRYSVFSILANGLSGNRGWKPAWREPEPKPDYDVVIVGGGGHGLATAYYLAKEHGIRNVAVLEKGWLGAGNVGRNTTIVRSNYLLPGNIPFYEWSMKLWEGLEQDLNYNAMVSQRGVLNLFHSDAAARRLCPARQRHAAARRRCRAARPREVRRHGAVARLRQCPLPDPGRPAAAARRHGAPRRGRLGLRPRRRRARRRHHPELRGHRHPDRGRPRRRRRDHARVSSARRRSAWRSPATPRASPRWPGLRLPIESHVLQAFVSEGIKPLLDIVITFGAGHFYISQSDKGGLVFGGDIDGYNSYAQRGNLPMVEDVCEGGMALMPAIGRLRMLRSWGGIMDMSMDGSPIIDRTPVEGLYLNAGWCYGGFKATPASGWCFAHLIATDEPHPVAAAFRLDRFAHGRA